MFYYLVKFRLANEMKSEEIVLNDHQEKFDEVLEYFNSVGSDARTYKKIINQKVTPSYVEIKFECEIQLSNPTMCFRNYSKYLIDTFGLESWVTTSGNFLKGIESKEISENETLGNNEILTASAEGEITDKEMVKQVLDLCFVNNVENAEEKRNRKRTICKIKVLLKEYQALEEKV